MDKNYKNLVFTRHAFERIDSRSLTADAVWQAIQYPDKKFSQGDNTTKFIKTVRGRKIHAVATFLKAEQKWLVVSAWVRGEDDKLPLVWQILVLPFKISWWLIKQIFKALKQN